MSQNPSDPGRHLTAENAAWAALAGTLADEERALVDGDAERLAALAPVKLERLHAASEFARQRLDALRDAGFAPDADGMDAWLAAHGDARARADWNSLRALETEARACNARVGKLIDMRLSANRQALNVLMHAANGKNGLYDPIGQAVATCGGAPLTSA